MEDKNLRKITQKELDEILNNHELWLTSNGETGERANLSSANLSYADLSSADLSYADLSSADLSSADLSSADLSYADLSSANLSYANLDFSAFPLWCGGLNVHIDDKQAIQLLYHLVSNVKYSKNTSKAMKKLCSLKTIIKQANKFHRVEECGEIKDESKISN